MRTLSLITLYLMLMKDRLDPKHAPGPLLARKAVANGRAGWLAFEDDLQLATHTRRGTEGRGRTRMAGG